jgi:hypothetical protein
MACKHYDNLDDMCVLFDYPTTNMKDINTDDDGHCQCIGSECPKDDCKSYVEE